MQELFISHFMFCPEEFEAVRAILSDDWESEMELEHQAKSYLSIIYSLEQRISFHLEWWWVFAKIGIFLPPWDNRIPLQNWIQFKSRFFLYKDYFLNW